MHYAMDHAAEAAKLHAGKHGKDLRP
jgi:hypothetical protein